MKIFVVTGILLYVSQQALGVEVFDGMELVQLPCQVNVSVSMESTVVWSREDLRFSTVHIHQQSGDDLSEQNQRYIYKLQVVRSAEGKECVVLPCKTKTHLPHSATIEWRRVDTDEVVHLYPSSQQQQPEMARGATEMAVNPLRTGDLSLTLFNPNHYDSGLYVCTVQKDGHNLKQKVVSLFVQG
ncbi:hypothetical protein GOODEAATRI_009000 [Goodea atripinnis]|uniref:Ig-like domain-containing protein n=1 Tax=Goodea atripinnis TaxID=208336 RepID=A0ABV0NJ05_9TELE